MLGVSMTYPASPLFDGEAYYYLAFENKKPVLQLTSEWEDIDFRLVIAGGYAFLPSRIISLNILRNMSIGMMDMCARLSDFVGLAHKPEFQHQEVFELVLNTLRATIAACDTSLPELPNDVFTR